MTLRRILSSIAATSLVLVGLVVVAPAAHAVHVTCGQVFGPAFANQTVTLDSNVGPCTTRQGVFIFEANGMTLNLNGFSIIGSGVIAVPNQNENGVYVFASSNVTIKNGTVTKWNNGIYLDGSEGGTNNTVTGIRAIDNIGPDSTGIFGEGIQIFQGSGNTIKGNQVIHNGPFSGINAYQSASNLITQNQVVNNNIPSDDEHHGSGPLMQDIGVWVINLQPNPVFSLNNTVSSNSITGNGLDGIQYARFTNSGFILSNSSVSNGLGQLPGTVIPARSPSCADGDGIANFGNSNQIKSNSTVRNGGNGISVYRSGSPAQGQNNTIQGNRSFLNATTANCAGIAFDLTDTNLAPNPPCDSNVWSGNVFGTKNQACVS